MNMPFDRREFLRHSAAGTLILGFPFLDIFGQDAKGPTPPKAAPVDFLALALARMKQEVKPGVVIVVPADPAAAKKLGNDLAVLLGSADDSCCIDTTEGIRKRVGPPGVGAGNPAFHRLLCQTVFVCVSVEQAKKAFPAVKPDSAVLLLDISGKPVDALKTDPARFGKDSVGKLAEFVNGKRGEHLDAVIKAQRQVLGEKVAAQIDADLRDLDANQFQTRHTAEQRLAGVAARSTALLAAAHRANPSLEKAKRLEHLFSTLYSAAAVDQSGGRLPFGVRWEGAPH